MMKSQIEVQPLPHTTRKRTFIALLLVFVVALPFLFLYANGFRFDFSKPRSLISTGGIYISAEREDTFLFIDDALIEDTRIFRHGLYVQNLDVGTHRVHVQKEGYHTWVKELPVSKHLVTVAESFNLPLMPQVRVVSEWNSATGSPIVRTPLLTASTTNAILATSTTATTTFVRNQEYVSLMKFFSTTTEEEKRASLSAEEIKELFTENGTTTDVTMKETATSTIESDGVRLARSGEDVFATWVGSFDKMPYYYCAPDFPRYSSTTATSTVEERVEDEENAETVDEEEADKLPEGFMGPIQTVPQDTVCEPSIRIDRKWQTVHDFDFFIGTTNLVLLALDDGIYVTEIDDRSWQNVQPLVMGNKLSFYREGNSVFVFDGTLIYQIIPTIE